MVVDYYNINTLQVGERVVSKEMVCQHEDLTPDSWHHPKARHGAEHCNPSIEGLGSRDEKIPGLC